MSHAKTLKVGLAGAAALLMLSACASRDDVTNLDRRVSALESRVNGAEARATQAETAANQCSATCQDVQARTERMLQQSMRK